MYLRSRVVLKLSALLVTLAVLFLFLADPVWPASEKLWPSVSGQAQITLTGKYQQIQPGVTYDPAHQCVVDHNGPAVSCAAGMPVPITLYEYKDPSLIPGCGPPTYPFQVDGIGIELCNSGPVPCDVWVVAQVYDADLSNPPCPQPGNLLCETGIFMISIPPTGTECLEYDFPMKDTCCVNGPYFAAVKFLSTTCPEAIGPCLDDYCDLCRSYLAYPMTVPVDKCIGGPGGGNWRICSWGRTTGQNDCPRDHFKTWRIESTPFLNAVRVQDQFMQDSIMLFSRDFLSNPVKKIDETGIIFNILRPNDHLTWYRAAGRDTFFKVEYVNQFESTTVLIDSTAYLLVPAQKEPHEPPVGLDHYKCYRIIDPKPVYKPVLLEDQFDLELGRIERVEYLVPAYLCPPCIKNQELPLFDTLTHYVAYSFIPQPAPVPTQIATDQFERYPFLAFQSEMLLVPSKKISIPFPDTCWYWKKGYPDYSPMGVPDFDQKQDQWVNSIGQWNYCGPTAVANCFWWFDSKFDSLSPGPPPIIHDGYPLIRWWGMPPSLDDHDASNVPNIIPALATCMNTGDSGTNVFEMESCLVDWLQSVQLDDDYAESTFIRPDFYKVEKEVERSQNVILLLGFYDELCRRIGGHFVTMAGVCSEKWQIAISDPFFDRHEGNPPGPPVHGPTVHNDAALISGPHGTNIHDIYQAVPLMPPDPCLAWGTWELIDYPDSIQYVYNFEMQNENPLNPNQFYQGGPLRTIVEFAVDISPESCIAKPGDANASNTITLADAIAIVNYIFTRPGWPPCPSMSNLCWLSDLICRGDANGSATVTLADAIYLVNYIFNKPGGPWTPIPNGKCCIPVM